jgi:hypothetical protein
MGAQEYAVVVDASDNVYVITASGGSLVAQAFTKGVGHTWTPGTVRSAAMPSYTDAPINNVAAAWHSVGTGGTIMVVASRSAGWASTDDIAYALLDCNHLLTGSGSLLRNSGSARDVLTPSGADVDDFNSFTNPTGSCLDVVAAPSTTDRGYVSSAIPLAGLGENNLLTTYRYVLAAGGTSISDTDSVGLAVGVKDAAAKVRVLGISSTVFAVIGADADATYGITMYVRQNFGTSSTTSLLGSVRLDNQGITSMPSAATLGSSSAWDAIYDATSNKIYIYYFDTANNRRLMRTSVDMSTHLSDATGLEISSTIGAVGGTNQGLRVHRGRTNSQQVLISIANRSSGGTLSTIYQLDTLNAAPTAPTLTAKTNFDATAAATFAWAFNDPNAGDTQSAYQLMINTNAGVFEYDSAKVSASAATYVGSGVASTGNNATLAPAVPSGNIGDTLVLQASIRNSGTGTPTAPTGWQTLLTFANVAWFGKVAEATSESAPSVAFANGAANADTLARVHRFRSLPLNAFASATQLNGSAANVAYPALTVPLANGVILIGAWKQDDWTSVAALAGMTEVDDTFSTAGDDAAQALDYVIQTTATNVSASSFTVTGGASAISRGVVLALGPAGHTPTASSHVLPANTLANAGAWQWRVRTYDAAGLVSPWSGFGTFSTAAGGNVTVTDPASDNLAGVITDDYLVQWSATGTTQAYYRVKVVRTSDSSTLSDTGFVASVATSATISGLLSDVEYRIEVTVRNAGLVDSGTGTRLITASYGSPDEPTATAVANDAAGHILVTVDNPAPTGDRPAPTTNLILRRASGSTGPYTVVGEADPDGTFRDYTAASGVTYEFVARATA